MRRLILLVVVLAPVAGAQVVVDPPSAFYCTGESPVSKVGDTYVIVRPDEAPDAVQVWKETNAVNGLQREGCYEWTGTESIWRAADTRVAVAP